MEISRFWQKIVSFRREDLAGSLCSKYRTPLSWLYLLRDEIDELIEAVEHAQSNGMDDPCVQSECGDVLGNVASFLLSCEGRLDLQAVISAQVDKYVQRKPYIFSDYTGEKPRSTWEERTMWDNVKKATQTTSRS